MPKRAQKSASQTKQKRHKIAKRRKECQKRKAQKGNAKRAKKTESQNKQTARKKRASRKAKSQNGQKRTERKKPSGKGSSRNPCWLTLLGALSVCSVCAFYVYIIIIYRA